MLREVDELQYSYAYKFRKSRLQFIYDWSHWNKKGKHDSRYILVDKKKFKT